MSGQPAPVLPTAWLQDAFTQTVKIESLKRTATNANMTPQEAARLLIIKAHKITAEEEGELGENIAKADMATLVRMIDNYRGMKNSLKTVSLLNSMD